MQQLYVLRPYVVEKLWGGTKLGKKVGRAGKHVGETWEVSTLAEGCSVTAGGTALSQLAPAAEAFGSAGQLNYLVKFIDTSDDLSIQVHPDDAYARRVEQSLGKTECWTILEAQPGAGIYLGFKPGVEKADFFKAVEQSEKVQDYLNFYPVKRGDFYFLPAGSVHAIGRGVYLAEVQQSSGVTYRVWDWNRVDGEGNSRDLHLKQAFEVLRFEAEWNQIENFQYQQNIFNRQGLFDLCHHPQFDLKVGHLEAKMKLQVNLRRRQAEALLVLSGEFQIERGKETVKASAGEAIFVPFAGENLLKMSCLKTGEFLYVD